GSSVSRVLEALAEPLPDRAPHPGLVDIAPCERVLGLDPGLRFLRLRILEPAVGIGDLGAVIVVDLLGPARLGIRISLGQDRGRGEEREREQEYRTSERKTRASHGVDLQEWLREGTGGKGESRSPLGGKGMLRTSAS